LLLPDIERLFLDRLSMDDIRNLAQVNRQLQYVVKTFAEKDLRRFGTFADRLSRAVVKETRITVPGRIHFANSMISQETVVIRSGNPRESLKEEIKILDINSWEVKSLKVCSINGLTMPGYLLGIIANNLFQAVMMTKMKDMHHGSLFIEAFDQSGESLQELQIDNVPLWRSPFINSKAYCNKFLMIARSFIPCLPSKELRLKVELFELTNDREKPIKWTEKIVQSQYSKVIYRYSTHQDIGYMNCDRSIIIVRKRESDGDFLILEHAIPSPSPEIKVSALWILLHLYDSKPFLLMNVRSGKIFSCLKVNPEPNQAIINDDTLGSGNVVVAHCYMGSQSSFCHYQVVALSGECLDHGYIDTQHQKIKDFCLYGRILVMMTGKRIRIFDTCQDGSEIRTLPLFAQADTYSFERLISTDRSLTAVKVKQEQIQLKQYIFKRPYPEVDE